MRQRPAFARDSIPPFRRALSVTAVVIALANVAPHLAAAQTAGHPPHGAASAPAAGQPSPVASTPDQRFLRQLADYYEGLRAQAHVGMGAPAGHAAHGAASDPAALDSEIDARQREVLQLLTSVYRDAYSPNAAADSALAAARPGTPGARPEVAAGGAAHGAEATPLAPQFRRGVALIDAASGRLRRPEVRALAERHRTLLRKQLGEPAAAPDERPSR